MSSLRTVRSCSLAVLAFATSLAAVGCSAADERSEQDDGALTSDEATFLDFEFDAEVIAPNTVTPRQAIITQLYYTEGRLTHLGGNSRPGFVKLADVQTHAADGGMQRVTYKASLPILWPAGREKPTEYSVAFPKKVDQSSLNEFNAKYDGRCGKNEYGQATFWHDFDHGVQGCTLDDDAIERRVIIKSSAAAVPDKYPEYDRIFDDGVFRGVSVMGLDGWSDQPTDKGVQVFERFREDLKALIPNAREQVRERDDFVLREVFIDGNLHGKKIEYTLILITQAEHANESFDRHFNAATEKADLVTYDGHSGLGKNIAAVTSRGTVKPGQYQIWFLDGCNSLGYVDEKFTERRREANGGADGTKFVDLIGNALPSYWPWESSTTFKLLQNLVNPSVPKSYLEILSQFPSVQVAAVVGDEDNTYRPAR